MKFEENWPGVSEEKFKGVYRRTASEHNSSSRAFGSDELKKTPNGHVSHKQGNHNAMLDRISKTKHTCQKKAISRSYPINP